MRRGGGTLGWWVEGRAVRRWAVGDDDDDFGRRRGFEKCDGIAQWARRWLGGVS
jgi:hypothetical protein